MLLPVQVTFRDIEASEPIAEYVRKRAAKLDRIFDRISSCRVMVEAPNRRHHQGDRYRVRIDLKVPRAEIVVGDRPARNAGDVYACIDEAFDDAAHVLQEHVRTHRADSPPREHSPHGRVVRMFPYEGYGFIEAEDGTELYFHRNSVLHGAFDRLKVGAVVRYVEEIGERGPQASTVEETSTRRSRHAS